MSLNLFDESIGFLMGQTHRKLVHLLSLRLKEYDITTEQWAVLYRLSKEDGINQKEIAFRSAKDQPTTTRILDVLYQKGLIEKQMSPTDRRAFLIYLTEKGRTLAEETIPVEAKVIEDATSGIESDVLEQIKHVLIRMSDNIKTYIEE